MRANAMMMDKLKHFILLNTCYKASYLANKQYDKEMDEQIRKESEGFDINEFIDEMREEFNTGVNGNNKKTELYHEAIEVRKKLDKSLEEEDYISADKYNKMLTELEKRYNKL